MYVNIHIIIVYVCVCMYIHMYVYTHTLIQSVYMRLQQNELENGGLRRMCR